MAFADLISACTEISRWTGAEIGLTRFRGDGWQILMTDEPELALRAALLLMARLRSRNSGLATRIAIGQGPIDFAGTQNLSDARGAAFTHSGRALDALAKGEVLVVAGPPFSPLHSTILNLVGAIVSRWTPEQAEAISFYIHPDRAHTLETIANRLGISVQAVSYRIRGAQGGLIRQTLSDWETSLETSPEP